VLSRIFYLKLKSRIFSDGGEKKTLRKRINRSVELNFGDTVFDHSMVSRGFDHGIG